MAITGEIDVQASLADQIQGFIDFELRNDFPSITMSGIGVEGSLCLNIGTAHALSEDEKAKIRKRIAERFIQFVVTDEVVIQGK